MQTICYIKTVPHRLSKLDFVSSHPVVFHEELIPSISYYSKCQRTMYSLLVMLQVEVCDEIDYS